MPSLTCPHCGSSLTAPDHSSAPLRCPVCGALLTSASGAAPNDAPQSHPLVVQEAVVRDLREEDDSATRPVAPELLAPILAEAVTAHTAPYIASATPADETTRALPNTPPSDTTQEMPLSAIPREPAPRAQPTAALRTVSLALAVFILLAVIVVAALAANGFITIGGVSTAQATATPTQVIPTATPVLTPFGVTGLYQIAYPAGWTSQQVNAAPQSYYALLSAPQGKANVNIEAQQAKNVPALSDLNAQFLRALTRPGTTPTIDPSPASVTIGGQQWTPATADVTLLGTGASDQPTRYSHVVILSTIQGQYAYTIVLLAPTESADTTSAAYVTADTTYFQPLLASFTFQS